MTINFTPVREVSGFMTDQKVSYSYKDASRYWWNITAQKREVTSTDGIWEVEIKRDENVIWCGDCHTDVDTIPKIEECLSPFLNYISHMAMGFAKYGK